ncbi:MAG: hypothetical protein MR492_06885 [Clostridiales bacterium]|nr:hypothetical protein [Clostridiales bacterium]MDD7015865.1 DNA-directed RNA polymerase subunit alpha C-terminal domain-containing protein [Bacillota bacterium]
MNRTEIVNRTELADTIYKACLEQGLVSALAGNLGRNINVSLWFSVTACDAGIEQLELSVRSYNALRRAGIETVSQLVVGFNEGRIKSVRNLGAKSFREIQTRILVYGFEQLTEKEKRHFILDLVEKNAR